MVLDYVLDRSQCKIAEWRTLQTRMKSVPSVSVVRSLIIALPGEVFVKHSWFKAT